MAAASSCARRQDFRWSLSVQVMNGARDILRAPEAAHRPYSLVRSIQVYCRVGWYLERLSHR
jgi:hypothetical protein